MSKVEKNQAYLESNQQLIIAAKVNWLCETDISFLLQKQDQVVQNANDIVLALDPLMIDRSRLVVELTNNDDDKTQHKFTGQTNLGNLSVNQNGRSESEPIVFGEKGIYRIGNYVAMRVTNHRKGIKILSFEHYFGYSGANEVLGQHSPHYDIVYGIKSSEVQSVAKQEPIVIPFLGYGVWVKYKPTIIYKSS